MRVYQGPYYQWFRPHRWLKDWAMWFYGVGRGDTFNAERYEQIEEWARKNWFANCLRSVENFFENRYERKIQVRIDYWDVWGADHSLAVIIVPVLKLLKEKKQSAPFVDDDDVPEHLRSTACPPVEEYHTDDNHFRRWDWVLDEMIWAMEQVANEDGDEQFFDHSDVDDADEINDQIRKIKFDKAGYDTYQHRVDHGLRMFGKYFRALWD